MCPALPSLPENIRIAPGLRHQTELIEPFIQQHTRVAIITDQHVAEHYLASLCQMLAQLGHEPLQIILSPGESSKTRETKQQIEDQLFAAGFGRDSLIIALGGGMICDLAGYVAATFCRGIPAIYYPTSLLAMVDASLGGKCGVNTPYGKNLIGAFSEPVTVIMDTQTLQTLSPVERLCGYAEMLKHTLITAPDDFEQLIQHQDNILMQNDDALLASLINHSCRIKQNIVTQDAHENGIRALLNFGHTIGHAIETVTQYQIPHGLAVAMGMQAATDISHALVGLPASAQERVQAALHCFKISETCAQHNLSIDALLNALQHDKKNRQAQIHFVLLTDIGQPWHKGAQYSHPVPTETVTRALIKLVGEPLNRP